MSGYDTPTLPTPSQASDQAAQDASDIQPQRRAGIQMFSTFPQQGDSAPLEGPQAPRGPPFLTSKTHFDSPVCDQNGERINLKLLPSISKGFHQVGGQWTCYRRYYFSFSCALVVESALNSLVFLQRTPGSKEAVLRFAIQPAMIDSYGTAKELVQRNPGRDKMSEQNPKPIQIQLSFGYSRAKGKTEVFLDEYLNRYWVAPESSCYHERLQFTKATANNGKRKVHQSYSHVVAKLLVQTSHSSGEWIGIAECTSAPITVRGRSPGHYKDFERRGSLSKSLTQSLPPTVSQTDFIVPNAPTIAEREAGRPLWTTDSGKTTSEIRLSAQGFIPKQPTKFSGSLFSAYPLDTGQPGQIEASAGAATDIFTPTWEVDDFDKSSISSASGTFSPVASRTPMTSTTLREPIDDLVEIILSDDGMRNLLADGFRELDGSRFERNLHRLLRNYASELSQRQFKDIGPQLGKYITNNIRKVAAYIRIQMRQPSMPIRNSLEDQNLVGDVLIQDITNEAHPGFEERGERELAPFFHNPDELQSLRSFLVEGDAFENLRGGLIDFVMPFVEHTSGSGPTDHTGTYSAAMLQDRYSHSSQSGALARNIVNKGPTASPLKSALTLWLQKLLLRWNRFWRPALPRGSRRSEWICDCGELLWGDFRLHSDGVAQSHPVPEHSTSPLRSSNRHLDSAAGVSTIAELDAYPVRNVHGALSPTSSDVASSGTMNRYVPQVSYDPPVKKYLELCINKGEYIICLEEVSVTDNASRISSDGQLFAEIRRKYQKVRGSIKAHKFGLFKPVQVNYVQFCLEDGEIGILRTPSSIPSETEIKSKQWEFCACPCPLHDPPPIPDNVFLHLLTSKRDHPRSTWLNRLPKKLNTSIYSRINPSHSGWQAIGWGIHIVEGPNGTAMIWLTLVTCATSFVFALLWSVLKGDTQGAYGIGSFLIALQTAVGFSFFNYYPVHRSFKKHQD